MWEQIQARGLERSIKRAQEVYGLLSASLEAAKSEPSQFCARAQREPRQLVIRDSLVSDSGSDFEVSDSENFEVSDSGLTREEAQNVRARELVDEHVEGRHRLGGARKRINGIVEEALTSGLPEARIIDVFAEWQAKPWPSSAELQQMLRDALGQFLREEAQRRLREGYPDDFEDGQP